MFCNRHPEEAGHPPSSFFQESMPFDRRASKDSYKESPEADTLGHQAGGFDPKTTKLHPGT